MPKLFGERPKNENERRQFAHMPHVSWFGSLLYIYFLLFFVIAPLQDTNYMDINGSSGLPLGSCL